jgi:hypothetical protein
MTNRLDDATLRARYEAGVQAHNRIRARKIRDGAVVMGAVTVYGESVKVPRMAKLANYAQLFCIAALFVIPNLLFIAYAF